MLNNFEFEELVDELILHYVRDNFLEETHIEIMRGFTLLESFGFKFYQDKFLDLIVDQDIDSMNKQDLFMSNLVSLLSNIVRSHYIKIIDTITLYEVNEILMGIYHINSLEDKSLIAYRVNGIDSPLSIGIHVLSMVCYLDTSELLVLITKVQDSFIEAVKILCQETETDITIDNKHETIVKIFSSMVKDTNSVGIDLIKRGVGLNNTFVENIEILNFNFSDYITNNMYKNTPQCALDILSLLLVSKDSYQIPLMFLDKNASHIFKDINVANKVKPAVIRMFQDFDNYREMALKALEGKDK